MKIMEAKVLLVINSLSTDLRYGEYLSNKMDKHYPYMNSMLRFMEQRGWIRMVTYKHRRLITSIDKTILDEARAVMEVEGKK